MSNGKKYLLSFTTFFNSRKGYTLFVNTHKRVEHKDNVPVKFLPWSRFEALILRDFKLGTKVRKGASVFRSVLSDWGEQEGTPPDKLPKVTLLSYMYKIHDYMQAQTFKESGKEKSTGFDFYKKLSEVIKTVNSDFVINNHETIPEKFLNNVDIVLKAYRDRFYMSPETERVFEIDNQAFLPSVSVVSYIHFHNLENNVNTILSVFDISEYESSVRPLIMPAIKESGLDVNVLTIWDMEEVDHLDGSTRPYPVVELQKQIPVKQVFAEASNIDNFTSVYRLMQIMYGDRALKMIESNFLSFLEFEEGVRDGNIYTKDMIIKTGNEKKDSFITGGFIYNADKNTFSMGEDTSPSDVDNPNVYRFSTNVNQDYVVVHTGDSLADTTQDGSMIDNFSIDEAQTLQDSLLAYVSHKPANMFTVQEGLLDGNDQEKVNVNMKEVDTYIDDWIESSLDTEIENLGDVFTESSLNTKNYDVSVIRREGGTSIEESRLGEINSFIQAKEIILTPLFEFNLSRTDNANLSSVSLYGVYDKTHIGGMEDVVRDSEYKGSSFITLDQAGYQIEVDLDRLYLFNKKTFSVDAEKLVDVPAIYYPRFEFGVLSLLNKSNLVSVAKDVVLSTADLGSKQETEFEGELLLDAPFTVIGIVSDGALEAGDLGIKNQAIIDGFLLNDDVKALDNYKIFDTYCIDNQLLFNKPEIIYDIDQREINTSVKIVKELESVVDKIKSIKELEFVLNNVVDTFIKANSVPTFECVFESSFNEFIVREVTLDSELYHNNWASLHKRRHEIRIDDDDHSYKRINEFPIVVEEDKESNVIVECVPVKVEGDDVGFLSLKSNLIALDEDVLANRRKKTHIVEVNEEDVAKFSQVKHFMDIVTEDVSSLISKSTLIEVVQEDEGIRRFSTKIISVDEDSIGRGELPQEPPWEESTKRNVWLIIGKQYPAWNGWNPKKTR